LGPFGRVFVPDVPSVVAAGGPSGFVALMIGGTRRPVAAMAGGLILEVAKAVVTLREHGRSILLVEQRVDLALQVCDRVYVLAGGEVVLEDTASALEGDGRSLIDAYLG